MGWGSIPGRRNSSGKALSGEEAWNVWGRGGRPAWIE